jgi:hypothetical protein
MRRNLVLIAVTILAVFAIAKVVFLPSTTVAGTHSAAELQGAVPVYELDVGHPDMKTLPVESAPMP